MKEGYGCGNTQGRNGSWRMIVRGHVHGRHLPSVHFFSMPSHQLKSKEEEKKNLLLLRNSAAEVSRLLKGSIAAAKDFFGRLNWTILG